MTPYEIMLITPEEYVRQIELLHYEGFQARTSIERTQLLRNVPVSVIIAQCEADRVMQSFFRKGTWPVFAMAENTLDLCTTYFLGPPSIGWNEAPTNVVETLIAAWKLKPGYDHFTLAGKRVAE